MQNISKSLLLKFFICLALFLASGCYVQNASTDLPNISVNESPTPTPAQTEIKLVSREYKLLLKAESLPGAVLIGENYKDEENGLKEFWKTLKGKISELKDVEFQTPEKNRQIIFFDSSNADLCKNSFILRERTGKAGSVNDLTFKFRNASREAVISTGKKIGGDGAELSEERVVDSVSSSVVSRFSYDLKQKNAILSKRDTLKDFVDKFPGLNIFDPEKNLTENLKIKEVNDPPFTEVVFEFKSKKVGLTQDIDEIAISLWYGKDSKLIIGEFSFKMKGNVDSTSEQVKNAEALFKTILEALREKYLANGTSKTALAYGERCKNNGQE